MRNATIGRVDLKFFPKASILFIKFPEETKSDEERHTSFICLTKVLRVLFLDRAANQMNFIVLSVFVCLI